ncbi:MAG: fasciclin domain-containing protein [Bacteroidales bacterium]
MKRSIWPVLAVIFSVVIFGITGCNDHQERYEDPPWLGGSSIETLEKKGNYTIFLRLMERADYADPIAKQLFTLFVPDDDAFKEYFASAGINSVEDLTDEEARQLFTLHVLRNPRSRFYLIYEYAWSELQTPKAEYASLFHRKETPSTAIPYKETVRYLPGSEGKEYLIYTGNKNIPLFSQEFFYDYGGAEDGSDYTFMYPGSKWEEGYPAGMEGLNWHNAMVIPNPDYPDELEVRTASGFIYYLDRVVPPMPSIEEYLIANQDKYGLYYDLLQRFANYTGQKVDEERNVLYRKTYDLVYDLAEERSSSTNTAVPPQNMWAAFIPKDDILQQYLDNTVYKYYSSIDSIPRVTLYYIVQTQLSRELVLKSKLAKGYFNAFGDATDLTPDDLNSGYMCSNGVVYDSKVVLEPNVFTTVPGILFFDKNYSTLLSVMNQSNMLSALSNPDADVTLFATTNEDLEAYGVRYNETSDVVEFRGPVDGVWAPMRSTDLILFAQDQIYQGVLPELDGEGNFALMTSGNHIYYGDNKAGAGENQANDAASVIEEVIVNEYNGLLLKMDRPIESRIVMGQRLTCAPPDPGCLYADPDFSQFAALLVKTKLLDDRYKDPVTKEFIPRLKFLAAADYWTAFIPNNAAMDQAALDGLIPENTDSLKNFLLYHFIIDNVIFDDGKESGIFDTNYTYIDTTDQTTARGFLTIANTPQNLTVEDMTGQVIPVEHADANLLVRQGVMHKITSVLKYTE